MLFMVFKPPACVLEVVSRILRFPQGVHGLSRVVVMLKGFQSVFIDFHGDFMILMVVNACSHGLKGCA